MADVSADVEKAVALVKRLAKKEGQPVGERHLAQRELQQCSGLFFTFAGAVLTVEGGSGFVIAKQGLQGGTWSAPLFITVFAGGVGLSLGYSQIDSVIVLDTEAAVKRYAAAQNDLATDVAAVGPLSHVAGQDSVSLLTLSEETFPYSVSSGALVDLSYKGMRYQLDSSKNKQLYGDLSAEAILGSDSTPPPAFSALYDLLNSYLTTGVMPA
ncbi:hypothetical protein CHLNCDRAFT_133606 [Chlorella variabilis]|uniref:Ysc84 actin-binding domain-containing protein n=1 Tax=Chlorella variabilis TaxID=554065 RepID=E1Z3F8_CHLVA|nr:hypothetical protein CHLNCDRAFT_133606 [Chlorella variabilis]EFN60156.1 hypothetical protein CHLNCDRAFT_133606 [Chlorella variabilis]|eukprot:XP_005852258.1 hypothetical protein CHLNCDRAFT_133606 [Chlorella variabilis]